jgi:hypothetical protein
MIALAPNAAELRALRNFASTDKTRPHLAAVWFYSSEGGHSSIATDGHTLVFRRVGSHIGMSPFEIEKLVNGRTSDPESIAKNVDPVRWSTVMVLPNADGQNLARRGCNPAYIARVADVERAAGRRAADDYVPAAGDRKKDIAAKRSALRTGLAVEWVIGCNKDDPWYFILPEMHGIRWEGLIMPRRL